MMVKNKIVLYLKRVSGALGEYGLRRGCLHAPIRHCDTEIGILQLRERCKRSMNTCLRPSRSPAQNTVKLFVYNSIKAEI